MHLIWCWSSRGHERDWAHVSHKKPERRVGQDGVYFVMTGVTQLVSELAAMMMLGLVPVRGELFRLEITAVREEV